MCIFSLEIMVDCAKLDLKNQTLIVIRKEIEFGLQNPNPKYQLCLCDSEWEEAIHGDFKSNKSVKGWWKPT